MLSQLILTAALVGGAAGKDEVGRIACGPEWMPDALKQLIPQGFHGADFRPACRKHDAGYTSSGIPRRQCDLQFRNDLMTACENSSRPILCRKRAKTMYRAVRLFGMFSYQRRGGMLSKLSR